MLSLLGGKDNCYSFLFQVQQQVGSEYEQLRELINSINMFKSDNPNTYDDRQLGNIFTDEFFDN